MRGRGAETEWEQNPLCKKWVQHPIFHSWFETACPSPTSALTDMADPLKALCFPPAYVWTCPRDYQNPPVSTLLRTCVSTPLGDPGFCFSWSTAELMLSQFLGTIGCHLWPVVWVKQINHQHLFSVFQIDSWIPCFHSDYMHATKND